MKYWGSMAACGREIGIGYRTMSAILRRTIISPPVLYAIARSIGEFPEE